MVTVQADLPDHGANSHDVRVKLALAQSMDAFIRNDIETFEQAERDGLVHVVAEALAEFKAGMKGKSR